MKNYYSIIILFAIITMTMSSCSKKNNATYIPSDAFAVAIYDGSNVKNAYDTDLMKEQLAPYMKDLEGFSPNSAELLTKFMSDYNALGILFKEKSFIFTTMKDHEWTVGAIIPIDKKKLEKNIDLVAEDFGVATSLFIQEKNGIKYFEISNEAVIGWNNDVFMFIYDKNANFALLEKHLNLKKDESILNNKDFKEFYGNCKYLNLWISSDIINQDEEVKDFAKKLNDLSGIDIANNYGHIHLDVKKDEISLLTKLKFNKSIQNIDQAKIMKNSAKISELLSSEISKIRKLFSGNDSYYDYDDYYNYGDDSDELQISDEELEEMLNELEGNNKK